MFYCIDLSSLSSSSICSEVLTISFIFLELSLFSPQAGLGLVLKLSLYTERSWAPPPFKPSGSSSSSSNGSSLLSQHFPFYTLSSSPLPGTHRPKLLTKLVFPSHITRSITISTVCNSLILPLQSPTPVTIT